MLLIEISSFKTGCQISFPLKYNIFFIKIRLNVGLDHLLIILALNIKPLAATHPNFIG